jgi:threonylcarbamoyladenosine tRNA methylthiotransferase MtaB
MPIYQIITFGCKVNQSESAALAEALGGETFAARFPDRPPEVIVVNTCTVTARADQQARQTLRRLARDYPSVPLVVTGCYAQRAPEELAVLPGVAGVWGNREKDALPEFIKKCQAGGEPVVQVKPLAPKEPFWGGGAQCFPGHTRAWLKIQDGCSHSCTYCIVPRVRGPGRSLTPQEVVRSLKTLADLGYQEVVLTGIDLGQYGQDLTPPLSLARLLDTLALLPRPRRLRLSSLEPQEVTPDLIQVLRKLPGLCPHFHLPLQSGSKAVLAAMGRPYRPDEFRDLCLALHQEFPEAAFGVDVLVGFPGESVADFEATRELLAALPLAYLHVFPYSPRPGTAAYSLKPPPAAETKRRALTLRELGQNLKAGFYRKQVGLTGEILVEGPASGRPGWLQGLSANYLRVLLPGPATWRNRLIAVRYTRVEQGFLIGEPLSPDPEP